MMIQELSPTIVEEIMVVFVVVVERMKSLP
jgi:hypothetical protein